MKSILAGAAVLGAVLALAGDLEAHGGMYRGPGPSIGPPGTGGGPVTPGGGGPTTPGGGGGPATGAGGGAFTGGRRAVGPDYSGWETWWNFNKHAYLNLRARLGSRYSITGLGRDGVAAEILPAGESPRPSFSELEQEVLPVLRALLSEDDPDIVDSAVLALARVTPASRASLVFDDIVGALQHPERSVKQAAILGLGVLGHGLAVPLLIEILQDSREGRRLLRLTQEVDEIQRAMAAVALGYLSDARALPALQDAFARSTDAKVDLKASCILALGLYQEARFEILPFLLEELENTRSADVIRAQIPIAIARHGEAARPALPLLLRTAQSRKTPAFVRQSCVVALGRLAVPEDAEVIEALRECAEKTDDQVTWHFAFIALGEIGARAAADPARHAQVLDEVGKFLLRHLVRPRNTSQLPWSATACALVGRSCAEGSEARKLFADKLGDVWSETRNPSQRAALAIALGLLEARSMGPALLAELSDSGDLGVKGALAEALGLMGFEQGAPELKRLLAEVNDADYRVQLATGLGLLGDLEVSGLLVKELESARTLWVTSSVAKALGNVGDRSALPPLLDLLKKKRRPGLARAFGAVALGLIGEKLALPWNARVTVGSNYIAAYHTQSEIMDIL
ncbi:MAG: HEAT repeat domain-containing protein [Planctomycetes bacterium]|nr:HEAT repeat domain-containing protein [Planctomycetota bacterium]